MGVPSSLVTVFPGLYPVDSNNHLMRLIGSGFQSGDTLTLTDPQLDNHQIPASNLTVVSGNEIDFQFNDANNGSNSDPWRVEVISADGASSDLSFTVAPSGTFGISASPTPANESAGSTTLTITRSATAQAQTVYISTVSGVNGFATNNGDYASNVDNLPVTFAQGQANATITLGINDLGLTSGNKTFGLLVQSSPTASVTDDVLATGSVTIADNDASPPDTIAENIFTQGTLGVGASITGSIDPIDVSSATPDQDWYKVFLTAGRQYTVSASALSGTIGTVAVDLRDGNGNLIPGTLTDAASPSFTYAPQTTGPFFIAVSAGGNDLPAQQGTYGLSLTDDGPAPPPTNASPVIGGSHSFSVAATQTLRFVSLQQNTTDSGGAVVSYQFTDLSGNGYLTLDDVPQSGPVSISAAQLPRVGFVSSTAGPNTIAVQATDDHGHSGSATLSVNVTPAQTGLPLPAIAADVMVDVYNSTSSNPDGYVRGTPEDDADGFFAAPYTNPDNPNQIIIAFRAPETLKNYFTDPSWVSGSIDSTLSKYFEEAVSFAMTTQENNPNAQIVLTGHSLGGAIAQLIGLASGLTTIAFDAPGAQQFYSGFLADSQNLVNLTFGSLHRPPPTNSNTNYRMQGDQVSLVGGQIGDQVTLPSIYDSLTLIDLDIPTALASHDRNALRDQVLAYVNGAIQPTDVGPDVTGILKNIIPGPLLSFPVSSGTISLVDPPAGSKFRFFEQPGPDISSFRLPVVPGVQTYEVSFETGTASFGFQSITPGTWSSVPPTFRRISTGDGLEIIPLDSSGNPVRIDDSFDVELTFAGSGTVTALMTSLSTPNDFNGNGTSDVLFQNTDGAPAIWEMNAAVIVGGGVLSNPGPSWHVEASADFNNDFKADIVLQNDDGLPQVWLMNGTSVASTVALPNPGSSWHVIAAGDFDGDGNPDILWQNTDGRPDVWLMNGTTPDGGGPLINPGFSWKAIGAGDFNGDGKADILWQNADGVADIWEMNGTAIIGGGALALNPGASWKAVGIGDFNGDGKADILWQNADGTPAIWEMNGTNIIGGGVLVNPGPSWHAIGTSDFNGDGHADIIWQNTDGTPAVWEMNGTNVIGGGVLINPGASWQVKDDGPIAADQMGTASGVSAAPPGGALHLSAPDPSAGAIASALDNPTAPGLGKFLSFST